MKTFNFRVTLEVKDPNFGDWVKRDQAAHTLEQELKEWADASDIEITVTNIEPMEPQDFIA